MAGRAAGPRPAPTRVAARHRGRRPFAPCPAGPAAQAARPSGRVPAELRSPAEPRPSRARSRARSCSKGRGQRTAASGPKRRRSHGAGGGQRGPVPMVLVPAPLVRVIVQPVGETHAPEGAVSGGRRSRPCADEPKRPRPRHPRARSRRCRRPRQRESREWWRACATWNTDSTFASPIERTPQ